MKGIRASEKTLRRKGDSGVGVRLRKNWIKLGLIELVAGVGAIIVGFFLVHFGFLGNSIGGWGMIFAVIGTVLIIYGSLSENTRDANIHQQRYCPYCGRRVASGSMICSRCGKA